MQRKPHIQKLRRLQDFRMSFDCTIELTARKDHHIIDAVYRMHKYPIISTTKDDLIPYSVEFTTIRSLQEITSNHINLSDNSTTSSPTSYHPYHNMPPCETINCTHVDNNLNKCRGRAETALHHHSCPYLNEKDMQLTTEVDYKVIKKEDKEVSSDDKPMSLIPEELFERYKVPSININLTDMYNNVQIVPAQTPFQFHCTTSSSVTMRNGSLDHFIRLF